MDRRAYLTAVAAMFTGCVQSGGGSAGASGDTPTATAAPAPTKTATPTERETAAFQPTVTFPTCTAVRVQADSYHTVFLTLSDDSVKKFEGEYSGSTTFETSLPVADALIYSNRGKFSIENLALEDCLSTPGSSDTASPNETSTSEETVTSTETSSPTSTSTPTETPTPTSTPSPTPDTREQLYVEGVSTASTSGDASYVTGNVRNHNPYEVEFRIRVDISQDGEQIATVTSDRIHLVEYSDWHDWEVYYDGEGSKYLESDQCEARAIDIRPA